MEAHIERVEDIAQMRAFPVPQLIKHGVRLRAARDALGGQRGEQLGPRRLELRGRRLSRDNPLLSQERYITRGALVERLQTRVEQAALVGPTITSVPFVVRQRFTDLRRAPSPHRVNNRAHADERRVRDHEVPARLEGELPLLAFSLGKEPPHFMPGRRDEQRRAGDADEQLDQSDVTTRGDQNRPIAAA
jgi:hypothetical protein